MPNLIITRPKEDAAPLASALASMGVETMIAPLMAIEIKSGPALDLSGVQALLFTSANGVRAFAARSSVRDLPAYVVGNATARVSKDLNFTNIMSANGDVDDLAALVRSACTPADGDLFHACASVVAGDLSGALAEDGFRVARHILYEAKAATALPDEIISAIRNKNTDGVIVYSPRTAHILDALLEDADLSEAASEMKLFALSQNVNTASTGKWHERIIAAHPCQESLLEAVRTCYY